MLNPDVPLGKIFSQLTKRYIGMVTLRLSHLDIERNFYAIHVLKHAEKALTQNELAQYLHVDKTSMVRIIDYLCDKKYVERTVNPNDRRAHLLMLTDKANEIAADIDAAFAYADKMCLGALKKNDQTDFLDQLQTMANHLCGTEADQVELNYKTLKS